ncbi:MAG: hypothetical protein Q9192_008153 [Flavoplaca navasiana]
MLVFIALLFLSNLVATIPIGRPPSLPQSLAADEIPNPWPFTKTSTHNIPGSDVRLTLTSNLNSRTIHPERIDYLMQYGLYALGNSERDAGGPHMDVNLPVTHFSDYGIQINVEDKTLGPGSEADGGKMKWGELRAIYQGVWSHAKDVGNTELKIEAWRMKTRGFPRIERKIKHLASGKLSVNPSTGQVVASPPENRPRSE